MTRAVLRVPVHIISNGLTVWPETIRSACVVCKYQIPGHGFIFIWQPEPLPCVEVYRPPRAGRTQTQSLNRPVVRMSGRVACPLAKCAAVSPWLYAMCTNTVDRSWQSLSKLPACITIICVSAVSLESTWESIYGYDSRCKPFKNLLGNELYAHSSARFFAQDAAIV